MLIKFDSYVIRDWHTRDARSLVRYANNRKIWINLRDAFPHPYRLRDALHFLKQVSVQHPHTDFAIANGQEAIGSIGFILGRDIHRFTAEIGYWLAEPFWNRGITSRAVALVTEYAFREFNLHRIYAYCFTTNPASVRVLEKAGFAREGILRASAFKDGRILDQFLYAKISKNIA